MSNSPILLGLGGNLPSPQYGAPKSTLAAVLDRLEKLGVHITARSRWYESEPVPRSDQPWFVNGVVRVETKLEPAPLLDQLKRVERAFGRASAVRNAARIVDLDLLAYGDRITAEDGPHLPHPRMHERAFVLLPLREIQPRWYHPFLGKSVDQLIDKLPPGQTARPLG